MMEEKRGDDDVERAFREGELRGEALDPLDVDAGLHRLAPGPREDVGIGIEAGQVRSREPSLQHESQRAGAGA
jgi:hypothetical protein